MKLAPKTPWHKVYECEICTAVSSVMYQSRKRYFAETLCTDRNMRSSKHHNKKTHTNFHTCSRRHVVTNRHFPLSNKTWRSWTAPVIPSPIWPPWSLRWRRWRRECYSWRLSPPPMDASGCRVLEKWFWNKSWRKKCEGNTISEIKNKLKITGKKSGSYWILLEYFQN